MAATMLERVCSGRITWACSAEVPIIQAMTRNSVTVHLNSVEWPLNQMSSSATRTPGTLMIMVISVIRVSKFSFLRLPGCGAADMYSSCCRGSEAILLHAPVKGAAAETERFRRMANISGVARQSLLNEKVFYFFQAHFLDFSGGATLALKAQVAGLYLLRGAEQNGSFHRVIEFTDVPRPEVVQHFLHRPGIQPLHTFAIALRILLEEMRYQQRYVLFALAQGRNPKLYRIEPEEKV